jgi:hypothetical protein
MSLESLPSIPDENGQSFDSGMDIDDGNDHIHRKHSISTNDGDTHDNIDVGIFEKIKECHIENDDNKLYSSSGIEGRDSNDIADCSRPGIMRFFENSSTFSVSGFSFCSYNGLDL